MGAPLLIINHTRNQYVEFCSSNIGADELIRFLQLYNQLISTNQWSTADKIEIENDFFHEKPWTRIMIIH